MARRVAGACLLLLSIAGCGGSSVGEGAEVSVYVSEPLCTEAKEELSRKGSDVNGVEVRAVCLSDAEKPGGSLDLASAGADARRATEDSTTVAFVEPPGREASFTRPILDEAEIALIVSRSGSEAMARVLDALDSRGGEESPREAVREGP